MNKLLQHLISSGDVSHKLLPNMLPKAKEGMEYTGPSIVDYLATKGYKGNKSFRKELAEKYGVDDYDFSGKKNLELMAKIRENDEALRTFKQTMKSIPLDQMIQMEKAQVPQPVAKTINPAVLDLMLQNSSTPQLKAQMPNIRGRMDASQQVVTRPGYNPNAPDVVVPGSGQDLPMYQSPGWPKLKTLPNKKPNPVPGFDPNVVWNRSGANPNIVQPAKTAPAMDFDPSLVWNTSGRNPNLVNTQPGFSTVPQPIWRGNGAPVPNVVDQRPSFSTVPQPVWNAGDNSKAVDPKQKQSKKTKPEVFSTVPQPIWTGNGAPIPNPQDTRPKFSTVQLPIGAGYDPSKIAAPGTTQSYRGSGLNPYGISNMSTDALKDGYEYLSGIYNGLQRKLESMTDEDERSVNKVNIPVDAPQPPTKKGNGKKAPKDNSPTVPFGYKQLYVVPDVKNPKDSLVAFINTFDNEEGGRYYIGHKAKEVTDAGAQKTFNNAYAVAHFLRDSDILPNQKITPESWEVSKGYTYHTTSPGKTVSATGFDDPEKYRMLYRPNPKKDGTYLAKYVKNKNITPDKIKEYQKQGWELDFTVNGTHKYSDIAWDQEGPSTGYAAKSKWLPLKNGQHTYIPYKNKDAFSRFSGGSGSYMFIDPKTGRKTGADVSGSVNAIKGVGDYIMKTYGVKPEELELLYHDMGSYSAKPKAHGDKLDYNQWLDYNTYNRGFSGAPMIIPKNKYGGSLPEFQTRGQVPAWMKPMPQATGDIASMVPRPVVQNTFRESLNNRAFNNGTIRKAKNQGVVNKALAIAANPMTAASYVVKGQRIPDNFQKGEGNIYDLATSAINPFADLQAFRDADQSFKEGNYADAGLQAISFLPIPELRHINSENLAAHLGEKLSTNLGGNNAGLYSFKNNPNFLVKYEDPRYLAKRMQEPGYVSTNLAEKMSGLADDNTIAKVYHQVDNTVAPGVQGDHMRALIMAKKNGIDADKLNPFFFHSVPDHAVAGMYADLKKLRDNELGFDFFGRNYKYDTNNKQLNLLDIGAQPDAKGYWADEVFGGGSSKLYGKEQAGQNLKDAMIEMLDNDYKVSYQPYFDKIARGEGNSTYEQLWNQQQSGSKLLKDRFHNVLKNLSVRKNGGPIVDPRGQWAHPGKVTRIPSDKITMQRVPYPVYGVGSNGKRQMMYPEQEYDFGGAAYVDEYPVMAGGGQMIRRADGHYSRRGLWDNIRANKGSGKKPTKEMLEQERKIRGQKMQLGGHSLNPFTSTMGENMMEMVAAPQKSLTALLSGKYQTPSEALGIKNKVLAFVTNSVLDPFVLTGGAEGRAAANLTRESKAAANAAKQILSHEDYAQQLGRELTYTNPATKEVIYETDPLDWNNFKSPKDVDEATKYFQDYINQWRSNLNANKQKQIEQMKTSLQYGKRPLEQFNKNAKDIRSTLAYPHSLPDYNAEMQMMMKGPDGKPIFLFDEFANPNNVRRYTGKQAFHGLNPNKYGGNIPKAQLGLWNTDKKAWVDSIHNARIGDLNFVQRLFDQSAGSIQIPGQPGRSTHYMEYGDGRAYPTVVQMPNGKLQYLNQYDKNGAWDYAKRTGQFIQFPNDEQAGWYASSTDSTSGYKMGTGVLRTIPNGKQPLEKQHNIKVSYK